MGFCGYSCCCQYRENFNANRYPTEFITEKSLKKFLLCCVTPQTSIVKVLNVYSFYFSVSVCVCMSYIRDAQKINIKTFKVHLN